MILGFSDDIISSSRIRNQLRLVGVLCLFAGPIGVGSLLFLGMFLAYFITFYPNSLYILLGVSFLLYLVVIFFRKYRIQIIVESNPIEIDETVYDELMRNGDKYYNLQHVITFR